MIVILEQVALFITILVLLNSLYYVNRKVNKRNYSIYNFGCIAFISSVLTLIILIVMAIISTPNKVYVGKKITYTEKLIPLNRGNYYKRISAKQSYWGESGYKLFINGSKEKFYQSKYISFRYSDVSVPSVKITKRFYKNKPEPLVLRKTSVQTKRHYTILIPDKGGK